ncbi:MAG: NAD(P) transhydrogenase subunit alpha [Saprospiraceae bacterium]|nr:NAD(P) transhydrogenase subunit alpha [Saprospiraceae bacterium]
MVIGILKEKNYKRVAMVPASIKKVEKLGCTIVIEKSAGLEAGFADSDYSSVGYSVLERTDVLKQSDVIVTIEPIDELDVVLLKQTALVISMYAPYQNEGIIEKLNQLPQAFVSMDMVPRTTLAQSMDVLSSMASLAGYKAVINAAGKYVSMFPMMTTAAGTIHPTRVMILGAGVAGLQAIATARRLGAIVEVFDTRAAAKEEVMSLGANFVEVEGATDDRGAGGYAVQQSEEFLAKQRALVQEKALKANIVIATAQVRGNKAPLLITEETINAMKPGSVIMDLAASTGGNCAFTQNKKTIHKNGVTIIGDSDLADELSQVASTLFSNNILNFLHICIQNGSLHLDENNEIIKSALISKF